VELGKKLSKLTIAVDVVLFGTESQDYREKLEAFIGAVQNAGNSHLCIVPPGPHDMADMVLPILMAGAPVVPAGVPGAAVPAAAPGFQASSNPEAPIQGADGRMVDPRLDPETALAIRMSMEEEYQRQQKLAKENKAAPGAAAAGSAAAVASASAPASSSSAAASKPAAGPAATPAPAQAKAVPAAPSKAKDDEDEMEDDDDEESMKRAMEMSLKTPEEEAASKEEKNKKPAATPASGAAAASSGGKKKGEEDVSSVLQDPEFLQTLLKESGVNYSVDSLLNELGGPEENDEEEDNEK